MLLLSALGLTVLLGLAACLDPNTQGRATHQQLGLPPCSFVVLFGRPCPTCGMTTAWAYLVRGQPTDALRANAGGTLLAALAAIGAPWLFGSGLAGRWLGWKPRDTTAAATAVIVILVTLSQWAWRLIMW